MSHIRSFFQTTITGVLLSPALVFAANPSLFGLLPAMMTAPQADPTYQAIMDDPASVNTRQVNAHAALVDKITPTMQLQLAADVEVAAIRTAAYDAPDGTTVWHGRFEAAELHRAGLATPGPGEVHHDVMNYVLLVRHGDMITGDIHIAGNAYTIRPLRSGGHAVTKIDVSRLPPPHTEEDLALMRSPPTTEASFGDPDMGARAVDKDRTKVLVLYANGAQRAIADVVAHGRLLVETTNKAFANSKIDVSLEMAGPSAVKLNYNESDNLSTNLNRLTYRDGVIDNVHALRDTHQADLVALIVNSRAQSCGIAWGNRDASFAFSVTESNCTSNFTFTHELGHNYGAAHDVANAGQAPYPYGYGYHHPRGDWGTIMTYPCRFGRRCPPVLFWSSPNLTYQGAVMGTAQKHHNQRVVDQRKDVIAGFR